MAEESEKVETDEDGKDSFHEVSETAMVKAELSGLVSDFKHLAAAELEYLKVRAAYSGRLAKWISIYVVLALFTGLCALIGLVVGLLLILSVYVGPIPATIITVAVFSLLAVGSALAARGYAKRLTFRHDDEGDDDV